MVQYYLNGEAKFRLIYLTFLFLNYWNRTYKLVMMSSIDYKYFILYFAYYRSGITKTLATTNIRRTNAIYMILTTPSASCNMKSLRAQSASVLVACSPLFPASQLTGSLLSSGALKT